ncbi:MULTISPECIES: hypothetical protein [Deefgea]|nr:MULTISPECIES: hypothetical protein [Deefgea]
MTHWQGRRGGMVFVVDAMVMCSARFPVFNMQYATGVLPET